MKLLALIARELCHRWRSSLLALLLIASVTAAVAFFSVNRAGFQKEVIRNSRDIGSNVVILPAELDQVEYHSNGGYSDVTMSSAVVDQLIEHRASLNHLIPMLEKRADIRFKEQTQVARIVGISASKPMPGRPKSPMQKSIAKSKVQLGATLADQLGIKRDDAAEIKIQDQSFAVDRVNRANGTWQDAVVLMDLQTMQKLFQLENRISRIEAIECTSEKCEETGLKSDTILTAELARITDQASLLRREKMADARMRIRALSRENSKLIQNSLWGLMALAIMTFSWLNISQRRSELGVLQAVGFGTLKVVALFVGRMTLLTAAGAIVGISIASWLSHSTSVGLFQKTGKKFSIDWTASLTLGTVAVILAILASSIPAMIAATRDPASLIGKEK